MAKAGVSPLLQPRGDHRDEQYSYSCHLGPCEFDAEIGGQTQVCELRGHLGNLKLGVGGCANLQCEADGGDPVDDDQPPGPAAVC